MAAQRLEYLVKIQHANKASKLLVFLCFVFFKISNEFLRMHHPDDEMES